MDSVCNATIEQGVNKGNRCTRPILKNGYCGKHQKQAVLSTAIQEGKHKCMRHRCITMLEGDAVYCAECLADKKAEQGPLCIGKIEQGPHTGESCDKQASNGDYCGKHYEFYTRLQEAEKAKVHLCDDGKRACKNITKTGMKKCDACLEKDRIRENEQYKERLTKENVCLTCGGIIESLTEGLMGKSIQQCNACYTKHREIENKRDRPIRDFKRELLDNIERHMKMYLRGACVRGKQFELTKEEFSKLVTSPCTYCGYEPKTVLGIDRLLSDRGYTANNCVSCCETCNKMKGSMLPTEFAEHITEIYEHIQNSNIVIEKEAALTDTIHKKSWLRPYEIINLIRKGKLHDYLEMCKIDKRHLSYISNLEKLKNAQHMKRCDMIKHIKDALLEEAKY